jgi:calcium-dependent protein kinase
LIDFGLATIVEASHSPGSKPSEGIAGTHIYQAPEARQGETCAASDMWSAGLILHILLVGHLPQPDVLSGLLSFSCLDEQYMHVSPSARVLLGGLLEREVVHRIDANAALAQIWSLATGNDQHLDGGVDVNSALTLFHKSNKLRQAALTVVATQAASKSLDKLEEQFLEADVDGNGYLSRQELEDFVRQSGICVDAAGFVEHVFDSIDTDGSGQIEYTEWLAAVLDLTTIDSKTAMRAAFNVFDCDRNGKISLSEIERIVLEASDDIASLLPEFDADGDGELNFEEFEQLLSRAPLDRGR